MSEKRFLEAWHNSGETGVRLLVLLDLAMRADVAGGFTATLDDWPGKAAGVGRGDARMALYRMPGWVVIESAHGGGYCAHFRPPSSRTGGRA